VATFFAYALDFTGGVRVAVGDVTGDGVGEIITGSGADAPQVRAFTLTDGAPNEVASFDAYDPGFRGGIFVAAGDLDGDGVDEIVTGAADGGGPHVRVFNLPDGVREVGSFFAYEPGFGGGVSVAGGCQQ
jgi:hypothetical protein